MTKPRGRYMVVDAGDEHPLRKSAFQVASQAFAHGDRLMRVWPDQDYKIIDIKTGEIVPRPRQVINEDFETLIK
jgi:hypothetical protein